MLYESTGDIMSEKEKIQKFLEKNYNYILTKDIIDLGIDKKNIPKFVNEGILKKVYHGIYMNPNVMEDEYYIIQLRYPSAIFSYNTAFFRKTTLDRSKNPCYITSVKLKPAEYKGRKTDDFFLHKARRSCI